MNRLNIWLLTGLLLALSACSVGTRNLAPSVSYDFGLPLRVQEKSGDWPSVALELRAPSWFDSLGIDYRLAYDDPLRLREYADSHWAANPGILLAQRLRQSLGFSSASSGLTAECLLRVDLQEFSQVFDARTASRGLLQGDLVLIDSKRQRLAEQRFLVEKAAATPDARGGVGALVLAANGLGEFISGWLAELRARQGESFCRPRAGSK